MFNPKPNKPDEEFDEFAARNEATAKWTGELLSRHYPGHPFLVFVSGDRDNAVIGIQLRGIMPDTAWMISKFSDVASDVGGHRTILKHAGEILEAYGLPRQAFSNDAWQQALIKFPVGGGKKNLDPLR